MRLRDMYVQPGYLIRRLHQRSTAEFATAVNGAEITQIQLSILLAIAEHPGTDATRISELIGSDRTTIGQALERLVRRGLVRRRAGTRDKRIKRLTITAAGESLVDTVSPAIPSVGEELLNGLDPSERATFLHLLAKVVAATDGNSAIGIGVVATANIED